jgi:hypothetical protein
VRIEHLASSALTQTVRVLAERVLAEPPPSSGAVAQRAALIAAAAGVPGFGDRARC